MLIHLNTPLGAIAVAGALLTLAACGTDATTASESPAREATQSDVPYDGPEADLPNGYATPTPDASVDCKLGYMNIFAAQPALAAEQRAAEAEANRLGCSIITLDDQLSLTKQVDDFNQLMSQGVDAIILYPIAAKALAPSVAKAKKEGVHVVVQNTPVDGSQPLLEGYATNILQGFDSMAYARAASVAQAQPGAKYALIGLAVPVEALQYFADRTKYWANRFGLEYVDRVDAQTDDPGGAANAASALLAKNPDLDVVFTYNDNAAVAASTVARGSGRSDVKVVGNNGQKAAFERIKSGQMFATTLPDFNGIGTQSVRAGYNLILGKQVPPKIVVKTTLVDQSSVDSHDSIG